MRCHLRFHPFQSRLNFISFAGHNKPCEGRCGPNNSNHRSASKASMAAINLLIKVFEEVSEDLGVESRSKFLPFVSFRPNFNFISSLSLIHLTLSSFLFCPFPFFKSPFFLSQSTVINEFCEVSDLIQLLVVGFLSATMCVF